jgi:class 3 adenylate cyclase
VTFIEWLTSTPALFGILYVGLAAIFLYADPRSPTTRALVAFFAMVGLIYVVGPTFLHPYTDGDVPLWVRFSAIVESALLPAFGEWLLRVARTAQTTRRALTGITIAVRLIQVFAVVYCGLAFALPAARLEYFYSSGLTPDVFERSSFWFLATPWLVNTAALIVAGSILFLQRIDPAERIRAIAATAALPFFGWSWFSSWAFAPLPGLIGALLFLVGSVRYLMMHSEREQFMSRFLSPDVAQMVRTRGLASALQAKTLDITVVCCDLRGFTPYAEHHPSDQVIELLREYYDAVGDVVAEFGGTIKDYAGDGILILVGAPLPVADHAAQGLDLARRVREAGRGIARKWSDDKSLLGIGLGVASGMVTVGAIGSSSRMEYTAVGSAVNLASRLCQCAADGDILLNARTAELTGKKAVESRGSVSVKGMAESVPHYALV